MKTQEILKRAKEIGEEPYHSISETLPSASVYSGITIKKKLIADFHAKLLERALTEMMNPDFKIDEFEPSNMRKVVIILANETLIAMAESEVENE